MEVHHVSPRTHETNGQTNVKQRDAWSAIYDLANGLHLNVVATSTRRQSCVSTLSFRLSR
jgi:hypothetical protein